MKLAEREEQILRVKPQSCHSKIISELENALPTEVSLLIKTTIEVALVKELESLRTSKTGSVPRRSGYFHRSCSNVSWNNFVAKLTKSVLLPMK